MTYELSLKLQEADKYWEDACKRVERVAADHRIFIYFDLSAYDNEFLFNLFDGGDYTPTDAEIYEAILEANEEEWEKEEEM